MSKPSPAARAAAALMAMASALPAAAQDAARPAPGPLTIEKQGSFFVGGRDVRSDALSTLPAYAPSGTISVDQIYVRYQLPVEPVRPPLVLIHGCCLTGKTWETTPDGRMGWDEYFVRRGFPTYVIDQAWRGRSAASPAATPAPEQPLVLPGRQLLRGPGRGGRPLALHPAVRPTGPPGGRSSCAPQQRADLRDPPLDGGRAPPQAGTGRRGGPFEGVRQHGREQRGLARGQRRSGLAEGGPRRRLGAVDAGAERGAVE